MVCNCWEISTLISADCTHPSVRGIEQIAVRWGHIMQETLQMTDF
ncbi:MAG: hypothetical protein ACLR6I_00760 [Waltera sp.]